MIVQTTVGFVTYTYEALYIKNIIIFYLYTRAWKTMDDANKFEECVSVLSEKIKWLKRHDFSDEKQFKVDNVAENLVPDRVKNTHFKVSVICI